jgi:hypothetical protein
MIQARCQAWTRAGATSLERSSATCLGLAAASLTLVVNRVLPMREIAGMEGKEHHGWAITQPRGYGYDRGACGQNHHRKCMSGLGAQQVMRCPRTAPTVHPSTKKERPTIGPLCLRRSYSRPGLGRRRWGRLRRRERHVWGGASYQQAVALLVV